MAMNPQIDRTEFGSITVAGAELHEDLLIRLNGQVKKRKKKLSKAVYGTSHILSLDEAKHVWEPGAQWLIIGTGQTGLLRLSPEAESYFAAQGCPVTLLPTPQAVARWNQAPGQGLGLFHITC
jgi:hypothetical protein